MGADESKPENYNVFKMHKHDFMQAYKADDDIKSDFIPIGAGQVQIGAKILQDINNGELYITDKKNKKWYLTAKGKYRGDAKNNIMRAVGYGRGPAIFIMGNPAHPKMLMANATDLDSGTGWHMVPVNSIKDMTHALRVGNENVNMASAEKYFGQAAVNPFLHHGTDIWGTAGDITRATNAAGQAVGVSLIGAVADKIIPGASLALEAIGVNDALQSLFDSMSRVGDRYEYGHEYQNNLADVIHDPRLPEYFEQVKQTAIENNTKFPNESLKQGLSMVSKSNQDMLFQIRKLQDGNRDSAADSQVMTLRNTADKLKTMLGGKAGVNWFEMDANLNKASSTDQKLQIVRQYQKIIKDKVLPILQKNHEEKAKYRPSSQESSPVSSDLQQTPKNTGIINGSYTHDHSQNVIQG
jgi:hypothetical protein